MITIPFNHRYHKLAQDIFTTIRGKSWYRKTPIGQRVTVEHPGGTFAAVIIHLELRTVENCRLEFLKADAEYPGFVIESQQAFCDLLNSFRARFWTQVTLESEITIITLRKEK